MTPDDMVQAPGPRPADPSAYGAGPASPAAALPAGQAHSTGDGPEIGGGDRLIAPDPIDRTVPDWYKDAIIYELHIKAFFDSTGDGIGDFDGLIQRLDYIQDLGVTAIWLLPFYLSPLRDDGYDIADYLAVNPSYGTMESVQRFIAEAHRRNLRVITELVINHTSDQHPWFQRAILAPPGSPERDFYVWSDTDDRYRGTRIIFLDTEKSNWTWHPVAQRYYWHRFYSHQPDLNFDNPVVLEEVLRVMKFWLDMGVDGLRLDAVPYLIEREGTNNENLAETHTILKRIRAEVDAHYPDRMLLAEANQWPEDTRPYFGDGDECHLAFHFPLMPRMDMAIAQEDRHPITDIIGQTPDIPANCQWAIFLRDHDELTLEMVTDEERDYLWRTYAVDRRARLNLGIRRRLAPLMDNDRRRIELLHMLLFTMPGTPVLYYGDEIGMGDNFYLGDRDGVRTPMQWSGDRKGGFSRANPQALFLPPIMDAIYGYQAINVEAQPRDPNSLLNWMRRAFAVRRQSRAFGRGTFTLLHPRNRKILAFLRQHEDETLLCVANLSARAQAVELDLAGLRGRTPIEMFGRTAFPPIGDLPYLLTLPAYGSFWFNMVGETDLPNWHEAAPEPLPEFMTIVTGDGWPGIIERLSQGARERAVLGEFVRRQRWFGAKEAELGAIDVSPLCLLQDPAGAAEAAADTPTERHAILRLRTTLSGTRADPEQQTYLLPLTILWGGRHLEAGAPTLPFTLAKVRRGPRVGALVDASVAEGFARTLHRLIADATRLPAAAGTLCAWHTGALDRLIAEDRIVAPLPVRVLRGEPSNVSIVLGDHLILKVFRRCRSGAHPELEMGRFLTDVAGFAHAPPLMGAIEHRDAHGEPSAIAAMFAFVRNQGDAWTVIVEALARHLEDRAFVTADAGPAVPPSAAQGAVSPQGGAPEAAAPAYTYPLDLPLRLGQRTAELHQALATPTDDPAFAAEPLTPQDIATWAEWTRGQLEDAVLACQAAARTNPTAAAAAAPLLERQQEIAQALDRLAAVPPRRQDPHPWRLSPGPGAGGPDRCHADGFRGGAARQSGAAPRQEQPDARRGRHAAQL